MDRMGEKLVLATTKNGRMEMEEVHQQMEVFPKMAMLQTVEMAMAIAFGSHVVMARKEERGRTMPVAMMQLEASCEQMWQEPMMHCLTVTDCLGRKRRKSYIRK